MNSYIFLNQQDKAKIQKIAQSQNVSLSTATDIIHKYYFYIVGQEKYYNKGNLQTHIKIKNTNKQPTNCLIITNCVYAYLHNEVLKNIPKEHIKKLNNRIWKDLQNTFDANVNKNLVIREMYRARKQLGL